MWQSYVGAGVLLVHEHRVLLVLRERSGHTRWELPSGLLEASESLEEAAARETREETGLVVAVGRLLCTVVMDVPAESYRGINAYFYASAVGDVSPRPGVDGEPIRQAKLVDVAQLPPRSIHPVDRRILNRWRRNPERSAFHLQLVL